MTLLFRYDSIKIQ